MYVFLLDTHPDCSPDISHSIINLRTYERYYWGPSFQSSWNDGVSETVDGIAEHILDIEDAEEPSSNIQILATLPSLECFHQNFPEYFI